MKPIGLAWIDEQWKPIIASEKITKGKDKGKLRVYYYKIATKALDKDSVKVK